MYVKCQGGCVSLFASERYNFPPPACCPEGGIPAEEKPKAEHEEEVGVVPCEGGDARMSDSQLREPPAGWLSSLWLGGSHGEE